MSRTLILLASLLLNLAAQAEQKVEIERWDRAVCLHTEHKKSDGLPSYASAFLIRKSDELFLVTAGHAAQDTDGKTKLLYRAANGESQFVRLSSLVSGTSNPWITLNNSDVAILKIDCQVEQFKPQLLELTSLAVDVDCLVVDAPPRTKEIEITGYPVGIGTVAPVSPLAMKGYIASRETLAEAKWGAEPVLYAVPTIGAGTSGGPVFLSEDDIYSTKIVGMYIGMIYDPTGVKLSKLVPARIVQHAVEHYFEGLK